MVYSGEIVPQMFTRALFDIWSLVINTHVHTHKHTLTQPTQTVRILQR